MPSILNSHFSDKLLPALSVTNGSSSLEGSKTLPKEADNGVLARMLVNTVDIPDMISYY
jgi:hypothetical protein